jgi:hypothetical protein
MIRPTVRQWMRTSLVIVVLSVRVASHPTSTSKSRVKSDPWRKGHRLGQHPVGRADQPAQPGADLQPPDAQIEMTPVRIDRAHVMAVRRAERAPRADQPPAAQRDLHHDPVGLKDNMANMHPIQAQQT